MAPLHIIIIFMNLQVQNYGESFDGKPDCVLLCQHAEEGDAFMNEHPEIEKAMKVDPETFTQFRRLEADRGSRELAHQIASDLVQDKRLLVTVVDSLVPRSIVDTNRRTRSALRNSIEWKDVPGLEEEMFDTHIQLTDEIRMHMRSLLRRKGVFVDVHSMAPFTPKVDSKSSTEAVSETPENLSAYIRAFTDRQFRGNRRKLDLITSLVSGDKIADPRLLEAMKESLGQNYFHFDENRPYPTALHVMTTEHMVQVPGIAIDVPKDMLLAGDIAEQSFDIFSGSTDSNKVKKLAVPLAEAVRERLKRR